MAGRRRPPVRSAKPVRGQTKEQFFRRPSASTHGMEEIRQRISREAARLIAEEGINDFHAAKRKATDRLDLAQGQHLPSNQEIEQALAEHLQLFQALELPETLRRLRRLALQAMRLLEPFEPRLVGSLLTGHVTRFSEIQLHVIAATPELVAFFLQENGIAYQESSKRLRYGGDRSEIVPVYTFVTEDVPQGRGSMPYTDGPMSREQDAQERRTGGRMPRTTTTIEISVFTRAAAREAPLSPVDGRPMKRAAAKEVEALE